MSQQPSNIYEDQGNTFSEEKDRLSNFDLPTQVSMEAIGNIASGTTFLDIGAGPNTGLLNYVISERGAYTAVDKNSDFLSHQKEAGANIIKGDIRTLPIDSGAFDITHARFVISHLGDDKQQAISEVIRVTKQDGRAIFLDYDWTTASGTKAYTSVRDFMINGGFLFDADYGAFLEQEVKNVALNKKIDRRKFPPSKMTDYGQVLKLREAGTIDLTMQGKESAAVQWNRLLDDLQAEADLANPPAFYFPGIVAVIVRQED